MCYADWLTLLLAGRLWLQALPVRSGLVPPSAAAARQGGGADPFKTLRRVVVQAGRVARPGAKGQREEWAVKFEGYDSREQVRLGLLASCTASSSALAVKVQKSSLALLAWCKHAAGPHTIGLYVCS